MNKIILWEDDSKEENKGVEVWQEEEMRVCRSWNDDGDEEGKIKAIKALKPYLRKWSSYV